MTSILRFIAGVVGTALSLLLCGCGEGSGPSVASEFRFTQASEAACGPSAAFDNGEVLYLLVPGDCGLSGALRFVVSGSKGMATLTASFSLPQLGSELHTEIIAGEWRTVSAHHRGTWRSIPNVSAWDWRDGAGLLAKNGVLYLLGGWNSDTLTKNDVWSTRDLRQWSLVTAHAPWPSRHGAGWVVHQDRLFIVGGDLIDDVWSSSDGITWVQEAAQAPFGKRYTPIVWSTGDRLVLSAGQRWDPSDWCAFSPECTAYGYRDTWSSTDGRQWQLVAAGAPWPDSGLVHGAASFRGRAYIIGGGLKLGQVGATLAETISEHGEVWSTVDGGSWRLEAASHGAPARTHHAVLGTSHGCYIAGGSVGTQANLTSEVLFAEDCTSFMPIHPAAMGRRHAASIVEFNGTIVVLGGHRDTAGTEIWQYFPVLN